MRLLKFLLVSLMILIFPGCAAYSVINDDRYYSADDDVPEMHYPQDGQYRNGYWGQPVEQSARKNCNDLPHQVFVNATLIQEG